MIAHVLALGPSIKSFKPDGNFTIGCNDIAKHFTPDVLMVVSTLSHDRAEIVRVSEPKKLLSHMPYWVSHPSYEYIGSDMMPWRNDRPNRMDKKIMWTSNNTPFMCAVWAFNQGYDEIVLWGVDLLDHPLLKDSALEKTWTDFSQLQEAMKENKASMYLGSPGSVLDLKQWK